MRISRMTLLKLEGMVAAAKFYYSGGNIRKAAHYWSKFHKHSHRMNIPMCKHLQLVSKFTDQQVYDITDYIKENINDNCFGFPAITSEKS